MARLFYSVAADQRIETMYQILQAVWTESKDFSYTAHLQKMQYDLGLEQLSNDDVVAYLAQNDQACDENHSQISLF